MEPGVSQKSHKPRVFTSEFKLKAVQRLLKGESVAALSADLSVARKDLYAWKRAYRIGGAPMLRPRGRPRKITQASATRDRNMSELERARQRIAELERKVGKQELELDFFGKALRCVEQAEATDQSRSASLSKRKQRKAN
jgi:transposase-like protein